MAAPVEDSSIRLAAGIAAAWLSNPHTRVSADQVPSALRMFHAAIVDFDQAGHADEARQEVPPERAVSVRKSLADPDRIVSMIDGRSYCSLKRHLAKHGLTPDEYRARYRLKADYPIVAPGYSARRSEHAKTTGLGRKAAAAIPPLSETRTGAKSRKSPKRRKASSAKL